MSDNGDRFPTPTPVRQLLAEALARRAGDRGDAVRQRLEARLATLRDSDDQIRRAVAVPAPPTGSVLRELLDHIADQATVRDSEQLAAGDSPRPAYPEVAQLEDARRRWSRIRAESQLRESLEAAPTDAGPLNSGRLVHRSITLMREQSPGYLQSFLSYLDALAWLEQMSDGGLLATAEAPRAATETKRPRKPRKRRE